MGDESKNRRSELPPWICAVVAVAGCIAATVVFGARDALGLHPEHLLLPLGTLFVVVLLVGRADPRTTSAADVNATTRFRDTSLLYVACVTLWIVWGSLVNHWVTDYVKNGWIPYVYCMGGWLIYTGLRDFFRDSGNRNGQSNLVSEVASNPVSKNAVMLLAIGISYVGAAYPSYPSVDNDWTMLLVHFSAYTLVFFGHVWFTVHYRVVDLPLAHLFCATYWLLFVPRNFWALYVLTTMYLGGVMYRLEKRRNKEIIAGRMNESAHAHGREGDRDLLLPGGGVASMPVPSAKPALPPPPVSTPVLASPPAQMQTPTPSMGHASMATARHSYQGMGMPMSASPFGMPTVGPMSPPSAPPPPRPNVPGAVPFQPAFGSTSLPTPMGPPISTSWTATPMASPSPSLPGSFGGVPKTANYADLR